MSAQDLGQRIREIRKAKDLTQEQLGKLADMHPTAISRIESGRRRTSTRVLRDVAEALRVDVDELIELRDRG